MTRLLLVDDEAKIAAMSGSVGADRMRRSADAELPKGLPFSLFFGQVRAILGSAA